MLVHRPRWKCIKNYKAAIAANPTGLPWRSLDSQREKNFDELQRRLAKRNLKRMYGDIMGKQTVPDIIKQLWERGFFSKERVLQDIKTQLNNVGVNPTGQNLQMALSRAKYLNRRGPKGHYRYIQKYAGREIALRPDVFSDELIKALGKDFEVEINDLRLNYGTSGTCAAFLLRKILEKLIFLSFAKNGFEDKLKNADGELVGLKTMLDMATVCKVNGKPFLMSKTAKEIEGIKFLGDTSAHNPLVNVHMKTIVPVMPFIITAYSELSKKL